MLISMAYFGAISRVFDHRHHVEDVTVGGIVGVLITIHTVSEIQLKVQLKKK